MQNWMYDEFKHCGVDYAAEQQAGMYDDQHLKFRDYEKEFVEMMDYIGLQDTGDKIVIDLGCGTGATACYAAGSFGKVYAVDVSGAMIDQARKKFSEKVDNIEFIQAGFLSYVHQDALVDLIITKAALHHLPDFWKQVALLRMNQMMKMGGLLYIHDVVFNFEPQAYADTIEGWIDIFGKIAGADFKLEAETHIRDEYSTFGWVLRGMLEKAGFVIEKSGEGELFVTEYLCRKVEEANV